MGKSTVTVAAILRAKKAAFDAVCKYPLTQILGRLTRTQRDKLVEEISHLALECNVTYKWAEDYGLLAEIMGNEAYLLLIRKEYTKPTEPPKYPEELDEDSTKDEQDRAIVELDKEKITYATKKGFHKGVGANIREALDKQYYKQLWHNKTAYKMLPKSI